MIDLTKHEDKLQNTVQRARERDIIIPTFEQMKNPDSIPAHIKEGLKSHGLWDLHEQVSHENP